MKLLTTKSVDYLESAGHDFYKDTCSVFQEKADTHPQPTAPKLTAQQSSWKNITTGKRKYFDFGVNCSFNSLYFLASKSCFKSFKVHYYIWYSTSIFQHKNDEHVVSEASEHSRRWCPACCCRLCGSPRCYRASGRSGTQGLLRLGLKDGEHLIISGTFQCLINHFPLINRKGGISGCVLVSWEGKSAHSVSFKYTGERQMRTKGTTFPSTKWKLTAALESDFPVIFFTQKEKHLSQHAERKHICNLTPTTTMYNYRQLRILRGLKKKWLGGLKRLPSRCRWK